MPMPSASNRNFTTLSHLYNPPASYHRDFVRENKEHVRDKSKQQTKGKIIVEDYLPPHSSSAEQISSQSSGYSAAKRFYKANNLVHKQPSLQAKAQSVENIKKKEPWTYGREASDRAIQKANQQREEQALPRQRRPNSSTKMKMLADKKCKVSTKTIAVQTDEINDEIYLYNALKKCASPAFKTALKAKYLQKEQDSKKKNFADVNQEFELPLNDSFDLEEKEGLLNIQQQQKEYNCGRQTAGEANATVKQTTQRADSADTNKTKEMQRSKLGYHTPREDFPYEAESNLNVMTMPSDFSNHCSPSKCVNCPVGYHLLGDEEREKIREKLMQHEALLIKQLNSFPLAIETLRVRQSKTRIEKELTIIEQNLRKLTKRKVYAKIHE